MAKHEVMIEGEDGWTEWIHPLGGYRMSCCDCGLTHELEFRIDADNKLNFRARRNNRATGQIRRHKKDRKHYTGEDLRVDQLLDQ